MASNLELVGGVKTLNPQPTDPRSHRETFAELQADATYYIGYRSIHVVEDGKDYKVTGGSVGAWVLEEVDAGGGGIEEAPINNREYTRRNGAWESDVSRDDVVITLALGEDTSDVNAVLDTLPRNRQGSAIYIALEDGAHTLTGQLSLDGFYNGSIVITTSTQSSDDPTVARPASLQMPASWVNYVKGNATLEFVGIEFIVNTPLPTIVTSPKKVVNLNKCRLNFSTNPTTGLASILEVFSLSTVSFDNIYLIPSPTASVNTIAWSLTNSGDAAGSITHFKNCISNGVDDFDFLYVGKGSIVDHADNTGVVYQHNGLATVLSPTGGGGGDQNIPAWNNSTSYDTDFIVQYNSRLYSSKVDSNLNNQPPASGEDAFWLEVSASETTTTPLWSPGVYSTERSEVFYYDAANDRYEKYVLRASVPFTSSNLEVEAANGNWQTTSEFNNISDVEASDLTSGTNSNLHFHYSDRSRSNHTGTQTHDTISDFDTAVALNTSVVANSLKVSADGSINTHSDVDLTGLADGQILKYNSTSGNFEPTDESGGGGHTIQDEGTPLTQRTNLNFVGDAVTVTDDSGNDATVVTINGGAAFPQWEQKTATAWDGSNYAPNGLESDLQKRTVNNGVSTLNFIAPTNFPTDRNEVVIIIDNSANNTAIGIINWTGYVFKVGVRPSGLAANAQATLKLNNEYGVIKANWEVDE